MTPMIPTAPMSLIVFSAVFNWLLLDDHAELEGEHGAAAALPVQNTAVVQTDLAIPLSPDPCQNRQTPS